MDQNMSFYEFLGKKSILSQPWTTWNPFTIYSGFVEMRKRVQDKGVEGNLSGEGIIKGGLLIISEDKGVIYKHDEVTGTPMPYREIADVLWSFADKEDGERPVDDGSEYDKPAATCSMDGVCSDK